MAEVFLVEKNHPKFNLKPYMVTIPLDIAYYDKDSIKYFKVGMEHEILTNKDETFLKRECDQSNVIDKDLFEKYVKVGEKLHQEMDFEVWSEYIIFMHTPFEITEDEENQVFYIYTRFGVI